MSNKRITDLTELTNPTTDDVFPVVDIATNTTTKVQLGNLPVPSSVTTALATKQDSLVSGTNIKTINSTSVLGSGNIAVQPTLVSGTSIKTVNSNSLLGSGDVAVQETLVSGTNIKTLNNTSLLGSGNITLTANPSGVSGAIQFSDGSAFASDATNLFWDDTNKRLGVGTNTPSSTVHINSNTLSNAMFSIGPSFATGLQIFNTNNTSTPVYGIGLNASYINTRIGFYNTLTFRANGTQIAEMTSSEVRIGSISGATLGIKGSGSTSATTSLLVQNSAGTAALTIKDDRSATFSGGILFTGVISAISSSSYFSSSAANSSDNFYGGGSTNSTFGFTRVFAAERQFTPSSGNATYAGFYANPIINQTGSANGITRGLYIAPTLTAAADFRAIETTAGKIIFGGLPTSSAGLVSGQLWNDAGTLKIA